MACQFVGTFVTTSSIYELSSDLNSRAIETTLAHGLSFYLLVPPNMAIIVPRRVEVTELEMGYVTRHQGSSPGKRMLKQMLKPSLNMTYRPA